MADQMGDRIDGVGTMGEPMPQPRAQERLR